MSSTARRSTSSSESTTEVRLVELPPPTKIHWSADVGKQESDRCIPELPAAGVPELEEVRHFLNEHAIAAAPFFMERGWLVEIGMSHQIRWNILREHNWGVPSVHIKFIYYVTDIVQYLIMLQGCMHTGAYTIL